MSAGSDADCGKIVRKPAGLQRQAWEQPACASHICSPATSTKRHASSTSATNRPRQALVYCFPSSEPNLQAAPLALLGIVIMLARNSLPHITVTGLHLHMKTTPTSKEMCSLSIRTSSSCRPTTFFFGHAESSSLPVSYMYIGSAACITTHFVISLSRTIRFSSSATAGPT